MGEILVQAESRDQFGKNASRRLRASGRIPGVIYGHDFETRSVVLDPKEVLRILQSDTGRNTIFRIEVGGDATDVLIRDYQLDPVKGVLIHADFQRVVMDETMIFEVPVEIVGIPRGVKLDGGILDIVLRQIELECLPGDVPDHIPLEVSELQIGAAIRVRELKLDTAKIKVLTEPDQVVVTVVPPHVEEEAAVVVEEVPAEPEVLKKGKAEEEEAEEE